MKQIIFLLLSLCFSQTWGITEQTKAIYNDLRNIYISDCSLFADYLEDPESIDIENSMYSDVGIFIFIYTLTCC